MPVQRETKLIGDMRKAIAERWPDAWSFKVHGSAYQTAGTPDLLVCVEGWLCAIEVKAPAPGESDEHARGRLTEGQAIQLELLAKAGATTGVAISVAEALAIIEGHVTDRPKRFPTTNPFGSGRDANGRVLDDHPEPM